MNLKDSMKPTPKKLLILIVILIILAAILIIGIIKTQQPHASKSTSAQIETTTETSMSTTTSETSTTTTTTTTTTTVTTSTTTTTSTTVTTIAEPSTETEPIQAEIPALSDATLQQIAMDLGVPSDISVTFTQGEPWWWDGVGMWIRYVDVLDSSGTAVASAGVDAYTGEPMRSISPYDPSLYSDSSEEDIDFSPNVWCPYCGYGFFTTSLGVEGLFCPNCGQNFMPPLPSN